VPETCSTPYRGVACSVAPSVIRTR
jgi:hypothetical protein